MTGSLSFKNLILGKMDKFNYPADHIKVLRELWFKCWKSSSNIEWDDEEIFKCQVYSAWWFENKFNMGRSEFKNSARYWKFMNDFAERKRKTPLLREFFKNRIFHWDSLLIVECILGDKDVSSFAGEHGYSRAKVYRRRTYLKDKLKI